MRCRGIYATVCVLFILFIALVTFYFLAQIYGQFNFCKTTQPASEDRHDAIDDGLHFYYGEPGLDLQLKKEVADLRRVRASVMRELVELETQRYRLIQTGRQLMSRLDDNRREETRLKNEQNSLRLAISSLKLHQAEVELRNVPLLRAPLRFVPYLNDSLLKSMPSSSCDMHSCYNLLNCSLARPFKVKYWKVPSELHSSVARSPHTATRFEPVCLHIHFGEVSLTDESTPFANHILYSTQSWTEKWKVDEARLSPRVMLVRSDFSRLQFRMGFDLIVPPLAWSMRKSSSAKPLWQELEPLLPARRTYLLTFRGRLAAPTASKVDAGLRYYAPIMQELNAAANNSLRDRFLLDWECDRANQTRWSKSLVPVLTTEWHSCDDTANQRHQLLRQSSFALIFSPLDAEQLSTSEIQNRLMEALYAGAVPLLLGQAVPPLEELLPWRGVILRLALARVSEVHFLLRSISEADIVEMRRRGRIILERYLGTAELQLQSVLATMRQRLNLPAAPLMDKVSPSAFAPGFQPIVSPVTSSNNEFDDYLGPIDGGALWPPFQRNFTRSLLASPLDPLPFHNVGFDPWAPELPTEAAQFGGGPSGSSYGFRPVEHSINAAGVEFSRSLGGNRPHERFTIVLLTYRRPSVILNTLEKLKGLPYLDTVVVLWNAVDEHIDPQLRWPDVGVKVHVLAMERNSLNNRFMPFDVIKTEAVLSMDDDIMLRQDEILFAFRVWRENRDRLVGFPARYHHWDSVQHAWLYNSNHTCEYSMILTGATFIHKYYFYLYWNEMPSEIRQRVDRDMNCEDLAMNFLVSHVTRRPPIKVTSRWTFFCPDCKASLYKKVTHFKERHSCLDFFTHVYGYNPLLYSQFRADSVLFKTRLPTEQQKCFKYI